MHASRITVKVYHDMQFKAYGAIIGSSQERNRREKDASWIMWQSWVAASSAACDAVVKKC